MKLGLSLIDKNGKEYMAIGHWGKDVVLVPLSGTDDQVLIYGENELAGLIKSKSFIKKDAR